MTEHHYSRPFEIKTLDNEVVGWGILWPTETVSVLMIGTSEAVTFDSWSFYVKTHLKPNGLQVRFGAGIYWGS